MGILLCFFLLAVDIDKTKQAHIQVLVHERWQLEAKAMRLTDSTSNRFKRVADSLSEAISLIERSDENVSFLGLTVQDNILTSFLAIMITLFSSIVTYFYKLQYLPE